MFMTCVRTIDPDYTLVSYHNHVLSFFAVNRMKMNRGTFAGARVRGCARDDRMVE